MNNNDAGEVELLLMDASAVEKKVVDVLIKIFGQRSNGGGLGWLMNNLLIDKNASGNLNAYIRNVVDIELNRRKDEYK